MKCALLLILLTLAGCADAHPQDSVLRLGFASGGICSATAVSDDVILSAEHCWNDGDRLVSINGEAVSALKMEKDGHDHVLVRVTKKFKRWSRIGANPYVGDRVRFWGCALGLNFAYREAYVSLKDKDQILYDGMSGPGDSGAGLFDGDGVVVGVVTGAKSHRTFVLMWTMPLQFTPRQLREMR